MYNHDPDIVTTQLIPPVLRQSRMMAWCMLLTWPLKRLWQQVLSHFARIDKITRFNNQTLYLRDAIIEATGYEVQIVDNTNRYEQLYLYKFEDDTNDQHYLFTFDDDYDPLFEQEYLYTDNDYMSEADYVIRVNPLTDNAKRIASETAQLYNPAGKKYEISQLIIE